MYKDLSVQLQSKSIKIGICTKLILLTICKLINRWNLIILGKYGSSNWEIYRIWNIRISIIKLGRWLVNWGNWRKKENRIIKIKIYLKIYLKIKHHRILIHIHRNNNLSKQHRKYLKTKASIFRNKITMH